MNRFIAAAVLAALSAAAWAHDEHTHGAPAKVDYSKAAATKFGRPADPRKAARTIHVEMSDAMSFTPSKITVKRGETVRLMAMNKGKLMHEMVLGTAAELKQHSEMMKKHPGMTHSDLHMAHVSPGRSGEIGWQFTEPGEFYFACLVPGHFEAGMVGKILVR